jgi:hypothetical protein
MRAGWPLLVGLHILAGVALSVLLFVRSPFPLSDVTFYFEWSGLVVDGEAPYRDFFFDYPPLALAAMLLPRAFVGLADITYGTYIVLFAAGMALTSLATLRLARITRSVIGSDTGDLKRFLVPLTLAMPLMLVRFEPWPMLLTALAFLSTVQGRAGWSGAWLGLGIATKLYPAVVLPAFAAYWLFARGRRAAGAHLAAAVATAAVIFLPFIAVSPSGILETLAFQHGRGLQVETTAAGIIQLMNLGSPDRVQIVHHTTYELVSGAVDAYLTYQPTIVAVVMGAFVAFGALQLLRTSGTPEAAETLGAISMALIIGFVLTSRAFSPQHVLWVLPFAWVMRGKRQWTLVVIVSLSLLVFPILYEQLLHQDPVAVVLLNARNALMAGLAIVLLARPVQRRATALRTAQEQAGQGGVGAGAAIDSNGDGAPGADADREVEPGAAVEGGVEVDAARSRAVIHGHGLAARTAVPVERI